MSGGNRKPKSLSKSLAPVPHEIFIANIVHDEEWRRDYSKDTKKYLSWMPTTHVIGKEDFENLLKHPTVADKVDFISGSVDLVLSNMYVKCNNSEYMVCKVRIPDIDKPEIICHWPTEPKAHYKKSKRSMTEPDEEDDRVLEQHEKEIAHLVAENTNLRQELAILKQSFEEFKKAAELARNRDKADFWAEINQMKQDIIKR